MRRTSLATFLLLALGLVLVPVTHAEEAPAPNLASDEEAEEALEVFDEAFKAKGLRGDDALMQRDFALSQLVKVQHPKVADEIAKVARKRDTDLRLLALIYLGELDELPGYAGKKVAEIMKRNRKDPVLVLTALQSIGQLGYLGAHDQISDMLKHRDYMYVKAAITAIGETKDARLIWELMKLVGVIKAEEMEEAGSSEPIVVSEGYSWEGAEARVDRGEADNTQENADAKKAAEAKIAANKAAAAAAAGRGGGGGGGGGGIGGGSAGGGGGGRARNPKELIPTIVKALETMTGEDFENSQDLADWAKENLEQIKAMEEKCEELEKAQAKQARSLR